MYMYVYMYICVYMCVYIYIYIYIHRLPELPAPAADAAGARALRESSCTTLYPIHASPISPYALCFVPFGHDSHLYSLALCFFCPAYIRCTPLPYTLYPMPYNSSVRFGFLLLPDLPGTSDWARRAATAAPAALRSGGDDMITSHESIVNSQ